MDRTHQLLQFLSQQPSILTQVIATLQVELIIISDIYTSYKPIMIPAINLLDIDPSLDGHYNHRIVLEEAYHPS